MSERKVTTIWYERLSEDDDHGPSYAWENRTQAERALRPLDGNLTDAQEDAIYNFDDGFGSSNDVKTLHNFARGRPIQFRLRRSG